MLFGVPVGQSQQNLSTHIFLGQTNFDPQIDHQLCGPSWKLKLARIYARLQIPDGPSMAIKYKIHEVWSTILFSIEEAASVLIVE